MRFAGLTGKSLWGLAFVIYRMPEAPSLLAVPSATLHRISEVLGTLKRLPGVEGAALARRDGVMVSQILPRTSDPRRVASISAGLVGTSDMAAGEIGRRGASHTIVATMEGGIVARKVGGEHVPTVIPRPGAELRLALPPIWRAAGA